VGELHSASGGQSAASGWPPVQSWPLGADLRARRVARPRGEADLISGRPARRRRPKGSEREPKGAQEAAKGGPEGREDEERKEGGG